jgi:hypothetical protein
MPLSQLLQQSVMNAIPVGQLGQIEGFLSDQEIESVTPPAVSLAAQSIRLGLVVEHQCRTEWCWAAVATSVSKFYPDNSQATQCTVANATLNRNDCCPDQTGAVCNVSARLDEALSVTKNLYTWTPDQILNPQGIVRQLQNRQVICCRIEWESGQGHFVAIDGYSDTTGRPTVDVRDPWYKDWTYDYQMFCTAYQGSGKWTDTYFTKPAQP